MSDSANTTPETNEPTLLWPESNSPTDLQNYRKWILRADEISPLQNEWTTPYRDMWPSVELTAVNPQEFSLVTTTTPLVSSPVEKEPFYRTFALIPTQFPEDEAPWTFQILAPPQGLLTVSQPASATELLVDTVSDTTLESILLSARGVRFEDGIESEFSRRLIHFITSFGNAGVKSLAKAILDRRLSPEVASEALVWLARIKDVDTYESRLQLLIRALLSPSSQVRDGASLGLALMNARDAIPWARLAVQWERNNELKNDMAKVLSQLERR